MDPAFDLHAETSQNKVVSENGGRKARPILTSKMLGINIQSWTHSHVDRLIDTTAPPRQSNRLLVSPWQAKVFIVSTRTVGLLLSTLWLSSLHGERGWHGQLPIALARYRAMLPRRKDMDTQGSQTYHEGISQWV